MPCTAPGPSPNMNGFQEIQLKAKRTGLSKDPTEDVQSSPSGPKPVMWEVVRVLDIFSRPPKKFQHDSKQRIHRLRIMNMSGS